MIPPRLKLKVKEVSVAENVDADIIDDEKIRPPIDYLNDPVKKHPKYRFVFDATSNSWRKVEE